MRFGVIKNRAIVQFFSCLCAFAVLSDSACAAVSGVWQSVDENTHKATSIVKIFKSGTKNYSGKILYLYPQKDLKRTCYHCPSPYTNQKVVGMTFITGLVKTSQNFYDHGTIIDPKSGDEYSLNITQLSKDKIKLRGYLGFPLFGRTQYWNRFKGSLKLVASQESATK